MGTPKEVPMSLITLLIVILLALIILGLFLWGAGYLPFEPKIVNAVRAVLIFIFAIVFLVLLLHVLGGVPAELRLR